MNDFDEIPELPNEYRITRDTLWVTQDRKIMAIKDMSDKHLLNTIRVLRDRSPIGTKFRVGDVKRRDLLNVMANEAYRRNLTLDEVQSSEPVHE